MYKPQIIITTTSQAEIPAEWEQYLWDLFKERIDARIDEKMRLSGQQPVDPYEPMSYFLKKYDFSKVTFNKIRASGKVTSFSRAGRSYYCVEQFKKAFQSYRPEKPLFKNSFIKRA
jgi:hypothetical protein